MARARTWRRRLVAGGLAAGAAGLMYQATVVDSRSVTGARTPSDHMKPVSFVATAYCKGHTTASGIAVRAGMAAADPRTLPLGSIVKLDGLPEKYVGIYTVLDTGPKVQGRHLDLYMWSCNEALEFGRRPVTVTILRRGWKPAGD